MTANLSRSKVSSTKHLIDRPVCPAPLLTKFQFQCPTPFHQLYSLRFICKIQWGLCWWTFRCNIRLFKQQNGFVRLGLVEMSGLWLHLHRCAQKKKKTGEGKVTFVRPPSTTKSVPLTKLLSSLARKTTAWACSMASPKRPVGK